MSSKKKSSLIVFLAIAILGSGFYTVTALSSSCGPAVVPAFLAGGAMPNLLLMIDNSASMYDLAYVEEADECLDDSYVNTSAYAGYFEVDQDYIYDLTDKRFEKVSTVPLCANTKYSNAYLNVCIDETSTPYTLVNFHASGNYLNWATASKLDVEKKVLTGGKYDSSSSELIMESRGCLNRSFVKQVAVTDSGGNAAKFTIGVQRPQPLTYPLWKTGEPYSVGTIVTDDGLNYICTSAGTSTNTGVDDDTGASWRPYDWWKTGTYYPAGRIVYDPNNENTIDEGVMYKATTGGISNTTRLTDDTGVNWETYHVTQIEIYPVTANGFDYTACQAAIDEMQAPSPNQGQIKQDIDDCMGYVSGGGAVNTLGGCSHAAFNHSIYNCWYYNKHSDWPPGAGAVNSMKTACEDIYKKGLPPGSITPEDRGYVCYGVSSTSAGYVGRCYQPVAGTGYTCTKTSGGKCTEWGWEDADGDEDPPTWISDACVDQAIKDYCGIMEIPEVIDPSDQSGAKEEYWNLPAVLIDSGVVSQVGQPLAVLEGFIYIDTSVDPVPSGLIQEFTSDIRMGAMTFNDDGSKSECDAGSTYIVANCTNPDGTPNTDNRDGAQVVQDIGASAIDLINAINAIQAKSWTPLAEAMYNALGYYGQKTSRCLDTRLGTPDCSVGTDPVQYWCQDNNILLITDGGSTADTHSDVSTFAAPGGNDSDGDPTTCGTLSESPLLDDLTYYAKNASASNIYDTSQISSMDKQNISTHIVVAGTLRSKNFNECNTGTSKCKYDESITCSTDQDCIDAMDKDECNPAVLLPEAAANGGTTLYQANSLSELESKLRDAFSAIREGASAGSAASVISASRGGEGAVYQAIFWPTMTNNSGQDITWLGEVHALFVDAYGNLYEDTNSDRKLDASDQRVIIYFDSGDGVSKACYDTLGSDGESCSGTSKMLEDVRYLWSAIDWLGEISDADILANRSTYITNTKKRYIFTWNDLDNNGIVDSSTEIFPFEPSYDAATVSVSGSRAPLHYDLGVYAATTTDVNDEVNDIVRWVRGLEQAGMRSRQMEVDFNHDGVDETITWRLGDVIHSTPVVVSRPVEGYHFLYRDDSYAVFAKKYQNRRNVIYFGGNDGMIHAVNGGFYNADKDTFCLTENCESESSAPALGAELWAYVPYNLLPHLKCLTNPNYEHQYYVDLRPRIFDVKIFANDAVHPGGWGTLMVVGMRLGGKPVVMNTLDLDGTTGADYGSDNRTLKSSYCFFDITDPESPPVLLGELTDVGPQVDLGYTTSIPTVVPMITTTNNEWYIILGSGPTQQDSISTQNGKIAVFPLSWLTSGTSLRIPDTSPVSTGNDYGSFSLTSNTFVSDPITVDFDLEEDYMADVVYFGTVSGDWSTGWGGQMYRLVTRKLFSGDQVVSRPYEWYTKPLINTGKPITAAPTVAKDGRNYWVYFGSGRFLHSDDKTNSYSNATQSFYGIKEPVTWSGCDETFTWETVEISATDPTSPGDRGLLRVDQIVVTQSGGADADILGCEGGGEACLPTVTEGATTSTIKNFKDLIEYIKGTGCDTSGLDGWYRNFKRDRERNLGQAALLGGLLTYTSYQPYNDVCIPEGISYLFGLYYLTGTPWYEPVFGTPAGVSGTLVVDSVELGRGLSTTPNVHSGRQAGRTDFVQTSTGAIREIPERILPIQNLKSGRTSWIEIK